MASTMAQLNVRMAPELKAAGDSVLDLYGVSPSELIRAVWEKMVCGETAMRQLVETLVKDPAPAGIRPTQKEIDGMDPIAWIEWRQAEFAKEVGLDLSTFTPSTDEEFEELLYEDWLEKERERGYQSTNSVD